LTAYGIILLIYFNDELMFISFLKGGIEILSEEERLGGKQRRFLRAMATGIDPLFQVGKSGITENVLIQIHTALEARELIKVRVLPAAGEPVEKVAREIAREAGAHLVQVIGRNIVLFRRSNKKPKIELP
jgi:RNA-binding protein